MSAVRSDHGDAERSRATGSDTRRNRIRVRVRFPEADLMGWVHHTVYFVWFEMGRTELMRSVGLPYRSVIARGFHLPVVEARVRYRKPAQYDQVVIVESWVRAVSPVQVTFAYRVLDAESETLLAEGETRHAVVNTTGRLCRMPPEVYAQLRHMQENDGQ